MSAISNLSAGVVRAGEGEQHTVAGLTFIFKSLGQETAGGAFIWVAQSTPGTFIPPHLHRVEDELIYVVDGELQATIGEETYDVMAGDLVKMPKGVPHAVRMSDTVPTKTLWTAVPAGKMESFFRALSALPPDRPPDPELIRRISLEHDMEPVEHEGA